MKIIKWNATSSQNSHRRYNLKSYIINTENRAHTTFRAGLELEIMISEGLQAVDMTDHAITNFIWLERGTRVKFTFHTRFYSKQLIIAT
jgi:hypothetical protein